MYDTLSSNLPKDFPADGRRLASILCTFASVNSMYICVDGYARGGFLEPRQRSNLALFTAIAAQQHVALQRVLG